MTDTVIIYKGVGIPPGSLELSGSATDTVRGDGTCYPPAGIRETSGPTTLVTGDIPDGTFTKRVGDTLIGVTIEGGGDMLKSDNLSGLASYVTARLNMGLGTAAITDATAYATAAQGALADSALQSIANSSITLAKMADMATASLIYRKTAATGVPEVNSLATLKTDLGLTGTNSGDQTITLTGDVTGTGTGSFATAIGAGKVTDAMKVETSAATSATTGTMTVNMTSELITITPTGACTFNASGGRVGRIITFIITTSGTSSFTLTWGTNFRKVGTLATGTTSARFFAVTFRCLANGTTWQEIARTAVQT